MPERPADDPATVEEQMQLDPTTVINVPPVPVYITGDVRTQEQPGKLLSLSTFYVDSNIRPIAQKDLRRARVSLAVVTTGKNIILATSYADVQGGMSMAPVGAGGAVNVLNSTMAFVDYETSDALFAASADGTAVLVTAKIEQWTD